MRTALCIIAMLAVVTVWGYFVGSLQNQPMANPLLVSAVASERSVPAEAVPRTVPKIAPSKKINVGLAYAVNCAHCHDVPQKLPGQMIATVMRHMRLRANLTPDETRAMLAYLVE
jgi:hypothetical protein